MPSLQDQLLKAGLVDKNKANKVRKEKQKNRKNVFHCIIYLSRSSFRTEPFYYQPLTLAAKYPLFLISCLALDTLILVVAS